MIKKLLLYVSFALLSVALCINAFCADTVYLNDGGQGDGLSKENPVSSLDKAYELLGDGGTIVITNKYTLKDKFFEEAHTNKVTITGGSFVVDGNSVNFYMAGPLTFENITITLGKGNAYKTFLISAGYHPLVLGKGIAVNSTLTTYVVGGYNLPYEAREYSHVKYRDSSILIESGTWSEVIGFSRSWGTTEYTGTSNITVNGGTVKTLYCGSNGGTHTANTKVIVNGGTITTLNASGSGSKMVGDAEFTINGGKINSVNLNNILGKTTFNYLGGEIVYLVASVEESFKHLARESEKYLFVGDGKDASDFAHFFDSRFSADGTEILNTAQTLDIKPEKTNLIGSKVYVSNYGDGYNSGLSPEKPVKTLDDAFFVLGKNGGTIVLMDMISITSNYTEQTHENPIVITSYDGENYYDGGLVFSPYVRYFLSGDTIFENTRFIYLSEAWFVARFNNITFGTGIKTDMLAGNLAVVLGGYALGNTTNQVPKEVNGSITVESGVFHVIIAYNRGSESDGYVHYTKGTQTVNVYGGEINQIFGGCVGSGHGGNFVLNIEGGDIRQYINLGGEQYKHIDNAIVNIKGGFVALLDMRNVLESTVVNWTDGEVFDIVCKNCVWNNRVSENAMALAGGYIDATYTLNCENVAPTQSMLKWFDTVNNAGGVYNLAHQKKVYVSSDINNFGWIKDKMTDGDRNNRSGNNQHQGWTSQNDTDRDHSEWAIVDLGTLFDFNQVKLWPGGWIDGDELAYAFPKAFNISVSVDGKNWTTLVSKTDYPIPKAGTIQEFAFDTVSARYVRFEATSINQLPADGNRYRVQISELEVYNQK